jgi:hypothetical protein
MPAQAIPLDQLRQYGAPGVHSGSEPGDKPVPALIIQHEIRIQHAPIVAGSPRPGNRMAIHTATPGIATLADTAAIA